MRQNPYRILYTFARSMCFKVLGQFVKYLNPPISKKVTLIEDNLDFQYHHCGRGGGYECATPLEIRQLMLNASLIVTDSFHGMALSINLSRQFIAFLRFNDADVLSQNSLVYDLLKRYGLMWRLYENHDFATRRQIEYGAIQLQMKEERTQSLEWLVQNIGLEKR